MALSKKQPETHPAFPSGEWEGFYNYGSPQWKDPMSIQLRFANGTVEGSGVDPVGHFTWRGTYSTETMRCTLMKYYRTHTVEYEGYVDENGIWGMWNIFRNSTGGFHIWPKKQNQAQEELEAQEVIELVKE